MFSLMAGRTRERESVPPTMMLMLVTNVPAIREGVCNGVLCSFLRLENLFFVGETLETRGLPGDGSSMVPGIHTEAREKTDFVRHTITRN